MRLEKRLEKLENAALAAKASEELEEKRRTQLILETATDEEFDALDRLVHAREKGELDADGEADLALLWEKLVAKFEA